MDRRTFLNLASAIGAGTIIGCSKDESLDLGSGWGQPRSQAAAKMLEGMPEIDGVLEIFMMGGMNPWDTFYCVPEHGRPDDPNYPKQQWWAFQDGPDSVPEVFDKCGGGSRDLLQPFALDASKRMVNLGPWVYPLRERPDVLGRMRLITMQHKFEPHQVAVPLMLCGHPRGTPRMCATPAHLQRYFGQLEPNRSTPFGYVLFSEDTETQDEFNVQAGSAAGLHPSSARPLSIRLLSDNPLPKQLERVHLGQHVEATDALVSNYLKAYQNRFKVGPGGPALESRALNDLLVARHHLAYSNELAQVLTPELLSPISGSECGYDTELDTPAMGLRLAANLLTRDSDRARYATYIDTGIINAEAAGYDTHDNHVVESSRSVIHTMRELSNVINQPGENNPNKLNLDRHLILITSEFGRTPYEEKKRIRGLNHWPFGYVSVAIGGPVDKSRAGIVGSLGPGGNAGQGSVTPAEFRAALLMAFGIWPFSNESFAVGDIPGTTTELEAAAAIRSRVFGYSV